MTPAGWKKASEKFFKANRINGQNKESGRIMKRCGSRGREDLLYEPGHMGMRVCRRRVPNGEQHTAAEIDVHGHS